LLVSYAAGSPDCRLDVAVHVLVVMHMARAKIGLQACIYKGNYSPGKGQSQGIAVLKMTFVTQNGTQGEQALHAYSHPGRLRTELHHAKDRPWWVGRCSCGANSIRGDVKDINFAALDHINHIASGNRRQCSHVSVGTSCR